MDKYLLKLRDKLEADDSDAVFYERLQYLQEAFQIYKTESQGYRYAKAFAYLLDNITVEIYDGERIAGSVKEEYLSEEKDKAFAQICSRNCYQSISLFSFEPLGDYTIVDPEPRYAPEWFCSMGHCTPDWEKVIKNGFMGIREEAQERLLDLELTEKQREFLECSIIACNAVMKYLRRYKERALEKAALTDNAFLKSNYIALAQNFDSISKSGAKTFQEAVQLIWITSLLLHTICGARDYGYGRMDKYLQEYYENDVSHGKLSREQAVLIMESFAIKCNEVIGRGWEAYRPKRILSVNSIQYIMIGGVDEKGEDATNELSFIILDAVQNTKLKQPTVNVRWHENIDKRLMLKASEIASTGIGYPSFFNDNICIAALIDNGIDEISAADYVHYGCNNSNLAGAEDELREAWHNVNKYLEFAINNGKSILGGVDSDLQTEPASGIESFEDLVHNWRMQLRRGIEKTKEKLKETDETWNRLKPFSFESVVMSDCIRRASSFNDEGSRYRHANNHMVGMATLANSMYVLDRVVFTEKRFTLEQFVEILKSNWKDNELLQAEIRAKFPKYGNDNDDVDRYAELVSGIFVEEVQQASPCENGRVLYPSIYSLWQHRPLGRYVGATPDGRNAGEDVSESQSPVYNTEENGPTAALNSIAKLPLSKTPTGGVNVKFSPSLLKGDGAVLSNLITAFFMSGGMHMQINVIDRQTLISAKQSPENYNNLLVRVVGYSAYFVTLSPEQQDEMIERTELV